MPPLSHSLTVPGRLAVLLPGLGAVSTTLIAGVELARQGRGRPVGSLAELGRIREGKSERPVRDVVGLTSLDDLVFGAWDIVGEDAATVAERSGVLSREHLDAVRPLLQSIKPRPGAFDPEYVRRIEANHVIAAKSHRGKIATLRQDIREFRKELGAERAVVIFCASTETYRPPGPATNSLAALERALDADDPAINPTLLYAYAALQEGVPFANATPNASVDTPAIQELAREKRVPIAGKDLKSGQTMLKTVIAPALKARLLGLHGWFSTNILGNRDGEVLDDPAAFKSKEVTKTGVLDTILKPEENPELYGDVSHKVAIHYYPPRGDAKEGWDNIDIFGWLNYPMQIKVNFLCRDSILAAPLVLDLALFLDLSKRAGWSGIQDWLSFYFKCPMPQPGEAVQHDLFAQEEVVHEALRAAAAATTRDASQLGAA